MIPTPGERKAKAEGVLWATKQIRLAMKDNWTGLIRIWQILPHLNQLDAQAKAYAVPSGLEEPS